MPDRGYGLRIAAEKRAYQDQAADEVHNLPPIFHHWSNTYIRPRLQSLGFENDRAVFERYILEQAEQGGTRFASIGSGNCELEIWLAGSLRAQGCSNFTIDCFDLNPAMLDRAFEAARSAHLDNSMRFVAIDLNAWTPETEYDAVLANQSLHHIVALEHLFAQIKSALKPQGSFAISDIIGRNGHLRWPEALAIVEEIWPSLPPSYRFNHQLQRYEESFEDWDCSKEAFEGIRAQDILPLLLENFHFHMFLGFANVIEPFVDRAFGPNFDASAAWDRDFIARVHQRDQDEIARGRISPTHMFAMLKKSPADRLSCNGVAPESALRRERPASTSASPRQPYLWGAWPHSPATELEKTCAMLAGAEQRVKALKQTTAEYDELLAKFNNELQRVHAAFNERTNWALEMERTLRADLDESTRWARGLDAELEQARDVIQKLDRELEDRSAWALQLNDELQQLGWARRLRRIWRKLKSG